MGEDSFLDIDYIADNHKKRYDVKNYLSDDNISIVLRRGGVARFDERNALEHLQHLLSLIREETAAFSAIGNEYAIEEELKQIGQNLASIYQNIKEKNLSLNTNPYLIFSSNNREMDMNFYHFLLAYSCRRRK